MEKVNIYSFLNELTKLSRKYGIFIGGCGCCGSPYLMMETEKAGYCKNIGDNLTYNIEIGYSCEKGNDAEMVEWSITKVC